MKRLIIAGIMLLLFTTFVIAQYGSYITPDGGENLAGKTDTATVAIIGFRASGLEGDFDVWVRLDTTSGDSCLGKIPRMLGEWCYLNNRLEEMYSVDSSRTWFLFTDSLVTVDSTYSFRWEPKFAYGAKIRWRTNDVSVTGIVVGRSFYLNWGVTSR